MSIFCSLVTEDCNIFHSQSTVKTLESASQLPYRHMMPQSISDQIRDLFMQSDVLRILYNTNIFLYIWDYIKIPISMNSLYIFHIITAYPLT